MGNTISNLAPALLSPNTVATSYNKKGNYIINSTLGTGVYAQLRRFREEATILATLSYPNIVALEDIGGIPDASNGSWNACIVTELADYNLVDFYAAYTALGISDLEEAVAQTVAHQLLAALSHLHERGLVHRDVKPANILVFWGPRSLPWTFKLADFGLAVHFFDHEDVAVPVARYTAPELLLQGYRAEEASKADIWALGKVCRDMCTRALMFPHIESKVMGAWATEATDWMLRENVKDRPTAKECREAVWVRQGERLSNGFVRVLRQDLGLEACERDGETEMEM